MTSITISTNWILFKSALIVICALLWLNHWTLPAIAISIIIIHGLTHEFIHVLAAWYYGCRVNSVNLVDDPYVDFEGFPEGIRKVYGAGAVYQIVLMFSAAILFCASGGWFWGVGYVVAFLTILYLFPERSDFQQWGRQNV